MVCRADAQSVARFKQGQTPLGRGQLQANRHAKHQKPKQGASNQNPSSNAPRRQISQVNEAIPPTPGNRPLTAAETDEYWRLKSLTDYGLNLFQISARDRARITSGPHATATIHDRQLEFLIDTGSPVNVIGEVTHAKLFADIPLEPCNKRYFGIAADKPLEIAGQFVARVLFKGRDTMAGFVVIRGTEQPIMSYHTASKLGIVQVDTEQRTS